MTKLRFDWDGGNLAKCSARVPREEIEALLSRDDTKPDLDPFQGEARYRVKGVGPGGRPMFVVFTFRLIGGHVHIRPISARYVHDKEARKWPKS
jgi:uncharacterized protein